MKDKHTFFHVPVNLWFIQKNREDVESTDKKVWPCKLQYSRILVNLYWVLEERKHKLKSKKEDCVTSNNIPLDETLDADVLWCFVSIIKEAIFRNRLTFTSQKLCSLKKTVRLWNCKPYCNAIKHLYC